MGRRPVRRSAGVIGGRPPSVCVGKESPVFDRLSDLVSEHAELEHALADPAVHSDQERARTLGRRYAELSPIVQAYQEWQQTSEDEEAARELSREDSSFAAEADQLAKHREE